MNNVVRRDRESARFDSWTVPGAPKHALWIHETTNSLYVVGEERSAGSPAAYLSAIATAADGQSFVRELDVPTADSASDWLNFEATFVGNHLIFGATKSTWNRETLHVISELLSFQIAEPTSFGQRRSLRHAIERIERLGDSGFIAIGESRDELVFSSFDAPDVSRRRGTLRFRDSRQQDMRTHAFFFRKDRDGGGLLGFPTVSLAERSDSIDAASHVTFVRIEPDFSLSSAGTLKTNSKPPTACEDSCVDWYGNSRPVFFSGRVFALLGNELVEGSASAGQVRELTRVGW
ncbi:MAG: hypothetical protein AAF219_09110 [Myxococcota bacterium]